MTSTRRFLPANAPSAEEALYIELVRTADRLSRGPAQLLREHDLSPAPYNVLRILRGAPDGLLCGEIAGRMVTREPDITRLLDRLEKRGLIGRCREDEDRRRVLVRITPAGLALLSQLDPAVQHLHRRQLGHLTRKQLQTLSELLAVARGKLE
ncbi:MAG: MarR family transcriptional regulator [Acidobacteriaceae bacterium]